MLITEVKHMNLALDAAYVPSVTAERATGTAPGVDDAQKVSVAQQPPKTDAPAPAAQQADCRVQAPEPPEKPPVDFAGQGLLQASTADPPQAKSDPPPMNAAASPSDIPKQTAIGSHDTGGDSAAMRSTTKS